MDQQNKHALIEKMDRIDTILDDYESSIGLATYQNEFANTNTAYAYMNMININGGFIKFDQNGVVSPKDVVE